MFTCLNQEITHNCYIKTSSNLGNFKMRILHLLVQHLFELLNNFFDLFQHPAQDANLQKTQTVGKTVAKLTALKISWLCMSTVHGNWSSRVIHVNTRPRTWLSCTPEWQDHIHPCWCLLGSYWAGWKEFWSVEAFLVQTWSAPLEPVKVQQKSDYFGVWRASDWSNSLEFSHGITHEGTL